MSKANDQLFWKILFPNISVVLAILPYNSLLKMNHLYYKFWTKESLSSHIWSQNPWICLIAKYCEIMKIPKFGTKNVLFGYFWATILENCCHIWNQHLRICLTAIFWSKRVQKCLIWVFLGKIFRKTIVIFKTSTLKFVYLQNFTKKQKCLNLGPKMSGLCIFRLEFENNIVIFEINTLEFV